MKILRIFSALLTFLLLSGCSSLSVPKDDEPCTAQIFAMDTIMSLTIYGSHGQEASRQAAQQIEELEKLLSATDEDSEIYAANHGDGKPITLSPDTAAILTRALELCDSTDGALDVTILPVLQAWGFTTGIYQIPADYELAKLLDLVDYHHVSLEENILTLPQNMQLDLGAVAKGYTGDRLMEIFKKKGVTSAIVELGGSVQALGVKPDGSPWRVGIQSPERDGYAGILEIEDKAVVTSGGYQRYFEQDGSVYWHILNPEDGKPARSGLASVTIVADEGLLCDALSTALFVMGEEKAKAYWQENNNFDFILIDEDGKITITEGLTDIFAPCGTWAETTLEVVQS